MKSPAASSLKLFAIMVGAVLLPAVAFAQLTLTFTNGVQKYTALTNATVTMINKCELWLTSSTTPLSGCTINLNSADAFLVLTKIKPSTAVSTYLGQVRINGATAVADSNCRVVEYAMGAVIVPHAAGFQPMQIFSGPYFTGASSNLSQYVYYNTAGKLGAFNANVSSFKLKRGYAVTLAQNANGSGTSRNYVAADGDLEISVLPSGLDGNVQFIYVVPWRWSAKKGIGGGIASGLNVGWYYNWNIDQNSSRDLEYVPIRQSRWWPGLGQDWQARGTSQLLGYNEPDRPDQANMSISDAISSWPDLLATGLRLGSPVTSDGGRSSWLYPFMSQASSANLRVDFVPVHYYWCVAPSDASGAASQLYNYLKATYDQVKRPLWVTEWNNGANWTGCGDPTSSQQQAAVAAIIQMLDSTPFVERYAIFNWVEDARRVKWDDGSLTSAGVSYRDEQSPVGYVQSLADNGKRGITQLRFETNTLDTSGLGNIGVTAGCPAYTNGHSGQALVFDGANTFVTLPPNIASASGFTFAAWIKWNGGANWQRIFDFGNSTTHYLYLTPKSSSSTLRFGIANGGSQQIVETSALPSGSWQHVAITLNGGTASLYVNGTLAAQNTGMSISPASFSPVVNRLGKSQYPSDPLFNGAMDEVLIKDYALTATQIAKLQTNTPPQFTNSLIALASGAQEINYAGSLASAATDADSGDTLTFSKQSGPAWLSVASNGALSGKPTAGDGGTNYFIVAVSDGAAQNAYAVVTIPVAVFINNGTWSADVDGDWSNTNNWSGNIVANGTNQTADFSTINITANRTVMLDSSRTIGTLKFTDTSGLQNWTLAASNGFSLKLDNGSAGGSPLVNVVADTTTISASVTGTNGFLKSGTGVLILTGDNPLAGPVYLDTGSASANDGVVRIAGPRALANASLISIRNNSSGNSTFQIDGSAGGITVNAIVSASGRNSGVVTLQNLAGTNVFNGDIRLGAGGTGYTFQSVFGLEVFTGSILYTGADTSARTLSFSGAGDHLVTGPILDSTNGAPVSPFSVAKSGNGRLTLAGNNSYANGTALNGGSLFVNGNLPAGTLTLLSGTTLGGNGVINSVVTLPSGATLMPGDAFGSLTVSNNVTLNAGSQTIMTITPTVVLVDGIIPRTNAQLRVTGTLSCGGTLTVTNLGGALSLGDSFRLFNTPVMSGSFSVTNLPALDPALVWNFNPVTGVLVVVSTNDTPPTISSVANQAINEDTPSAPIAFTVSDGETAAASLVMSAASSNPNLAPVSGIVFGGSGSNRTVTLTPATNQTGSATITLNVNDGALNASTSFLLTVNPVNDPPGISTVPNQSWNKNIVIGPLPFTVNDPETAAGSLTLSAASSTNLIPLSGIVFGGSGSNRTVTVTPAANQGGVATITLTVSDGALTANSQFLVTIAAVTPVNKADNTTNLNLSSSWIGGAVPGANSIAVWDSTVTSPNTVSLGTNLSWSGLSISNPAGPVTIASGNTLTLGASGINLAAATQNLTISSSLTVGAGDQAWNITNGRTLTLNTGAFVRTNSGTVNLPGSGTVAVSMTGITNDTSLLTPGIVGPWLTIGTGASTRYASVSGGNLVSYTGFGAAFNWNTALPNNTNMEVSASVAAIGVDRMCNTLRWSGGTATQPYGSGSSANRLILNGLMNAGTGPLTFSINSGTPRMVIGTNNSNSELVLHAANAGIVINLPIADSAAGASKVTVVGPNTVTLAGVSTYTGETLVNSGTLKLGVANPISTSSGLTVHGTLDMASFSGTIAALSGAGVVDNSVAGMPTLTVNGAVNSTFSGTLKNSAGTLALAKTGAGTLTLASGNIFSGITTIGASQGAGTIRAAANQALGTNAIVFDGTGNGSTARLELTGGITLPNAITLSGRNNSSVAIQSLVGSNYISGQIGMVAGGGSYNIQSDADLLTLGTVGSTAITIASSGTRYVTLQGAGNGSVNGNITDGGGALAVSLVGPGTWTLNGANTYSGGTTNIAGTLIVNGSLASGNVIALGGKLGGNGIIGGAVTMQSGSTLSPGNSIGKLTINNDLTLAGATLMEINKSAATNDQLIVAGTLTFGGTLVVTNQSGTLAVGDSFYLFNAALTGGAFSDFNLPPLGAGLAWDTSNLAGGVISVVATVGPEFSVMSRTGDGNFHFTGTGAAGIAYELDATTNLIPPIVWEFVTNAIADQSGYFELRDLSATNFPQRFYRIMSTP